jgi:progranulin
MISPGAFLGLPSALVLLLASHAFGQDYNRPPTVIKKMGLDQGEKIFPDYMAFEESFGEQPLSPHEAILMARSVPDIDEEGFLSPRLPPVLTHRMPFAAHERADDGSRWAVLRRAAEALSILQNRQACPEGMKSCSSIGFPNKCCMNSENCVQVNDASVGNVACCPSGSTCSGGVAGCPVGIGVTSCPVELGGGCCIPGFVCSGQICTSASW